MKQIPKKIYEDYGLSWRQIGFLGVLAYNDNKMTLQHYQKDLVFVRTLERKGLVQSYESSRGLEITATWPDKKVELDLDWNALLNYISQKTGITRRVFSEKAKRAFILRLKEGFTKEQIFHAIANAPQEPHHRESNCKYLTPEFFSRAKTLELYGHKRARQKTYTEILGEGGFVNP